MNKKQIAMTLLTLVTLTASSALADGAPTSQFGFKGWPYRQSTSCASKTEATSCPTSCPTECPTIEPTVEPTAAPTEEPTLAPTEAPTVAPTATIAPTAAPTIAPKPQATQKPTQAPVPTASSPANGGDYTTVIDSTQEEIAFSLLNEDRARYGLPALTLDPELSRLARMKSCDMNANQYFAHLSPTLGSASTMLKNNGYAFTSVGENIAHHATVEKAQAAFMSSTGHRTNILGSQWQKVGIGVCYDAQGYVYVTQLFVR